MGLTTSRRVALVVACALVVPACAGTTSSAPTGSAGCVDDVLAGYRGLTTPARDVAAAYGSVVRETAKLAFSAPVRGIRVTVGEIFDGSPEDVPAKLRRILLGVRKAFGDVGDATRTYGRAALAAARAAAACAAKDGSSCREALDGLTTALRGAAASVERSARDLRDALRRHNADVERLGVMLERSGIALERRQARLEGAAAAAAACV